MAAEATRASSMGAALETAEDLEVDAPNGLAHVATPEEAKKHGLGIPPGKDLSAGFDAGRSPRASTAIDAVRQRAAMDPRAPSANDGDTQGCGRTNFAREGDRAWRSDARRRKRDAGGHALIRCDGRRSRRRARIGDRQRGFDRRGRLSILDPNGLVQSEPMKRC